MSIPSLSLCLFSKQGHFELTLCVFGKGMNPWLKDTEIPLDFSVPCEWRENVAVFLVNKISNQIVKQYQFFQYNMKVAWLKFGKGSSFCVTHLWLHVWAWQLKGHRGSPIKTNYPSICVFLSLSKYQSVGCTTVRKWTYTDRIGIKLTRGQYSSYFHARGIK